VINPNTGPKNPGPTSDDNTVSVRPVKLGPGDGERVAVESGLAAGERVVVDGMDRLREGARVQAGAVR
jgi:multidrug efflux system membrane fusion protein